MIEILVSATVLMIVILCLRLLTKGRVSMRLRYALWLLVALPASFPVKVQILEEDNGLPRRFVSRSTVPRRRNGSCTWQTGTIPARSSLPVSTGRRAAGCWRRSRSEELGKYDCFSGGKINNIGKVTKIAKFKIIRDKILSYCVFLW